jgi:hypothetical protein
VAHLVLLWVVDVGGWFLTYFIDFTLAQSGGCKIIRWLQGIFEGKLLAFAVHNITQLTSCIHAPSIRIKNVASRCRNCFILNLKSGHANTTYHHSNVIWTQTWLHHFCRVCLYNFVCVASKWTPYLKQFQKLQDGNHLIPPKVYHIFFVPKWSLIGGLL